MSDGKNTSNGTYSRNQSGLATPKNSEVSVQPAPPFKQISEAYTSRLLDIRFSLRYANVNDDLAPSRGAVSASVRVVSPRVPYLWGTLSYTWARRGHQPTIKTSGKRKGYKVFGLIDYFTGRFFYKCQEQRLTSATYAAYLEEVLAKTRKHIVIIQDGARYHTSAAMQEFFTKHKDRLTVFDLPSYSPDYNPIEKLWKKVKQKGTHLHYFPTFEALKGKVHESLELFKNASQEVLSLFGLYHEMVTA